MKPKHIHDLQRGGIFADTYESVYSSTGPVRNPIIEEREDHLDCFIELSNELVAEDKTKFLQKYSDSKKTIKQLTIFLTQVVNCLPPEIVYKYVEKYNTIALKEMMIDSSSIKFLDA